MSKLMYTKNDTSRIRLEEEKNDLGRTPFRRDYGRLLHSPAFRRLQGKTQLFPSDESDFFRNRLTHSLEVAQIAKGIAQYLNATSPELQGPGKELDVDLIEFAGIAHDLGHPPFGHNGERALDECMKKDGGFEGNAQTLRILTKVERKVYSESLDSAFIHGITDDGTDARLGLNLTYRSLASILKYDALINPTRDDDSDLEKGYYASEADIVRAIKENVAPGHTGKFKTIECQIMDIADDIAYSTYDLEDAMKGGFLTPLEMLSRVSEPLFMQSLTKKVRGELPYITENDVNEALNSLLGFVDEKPLSTYKESNQIAENAHVRTKFSSKLVHEFMMGISIKPAENMALANLIIDADIKLKIETLKHFSYLSVIMSSELKIGEYRGGDIVKALFKAFTSENGDRLLPKDVRFMVGKLANPSDKKRVICDFVAGMTDRYAVDFYNRLYGNAASLYKPI